MVIDDFEDVSDWSTFGSGQATIRISSEQGPRGRALRLDFDFAGGGGFVIARKVCSLRLGTDYAFTFDIRGAAPANKFEMKLIDASGQNVWWRHYDAFAWPEQWQPLRIDSSDITFAWGPAGDSRIEETGAIEFAIAAGPGGKGTVWIHDLRVEDTAYHGIPTVQASSAAADHPAAALVDARAGAGARDDADAAPSWRNRRNAAPSWRNRRNAAPSWRNRPDAAPSWRNRRNAAPGWRSDTPGPQWVLLDFVTSREFGGLVIEWEASRGATRFDVSLSNDAVHWRIVQSLDGAGGARTYLFMPGSRCRYLRLDLHEAQGGDGFGIVALEIKPRDFSRSIDAFFHDIALTEPAGTFPKYQRGEQTYWSPVAVPGGASQGLLNEEGMLETDLGGFSLEPFVYADGTLLTWADVAITQTLEDEYLPIPSSCWKGGGVRLQTTAFAAGDAQQPVLYARYRVENTGAAATTIVLFVAVRPLQVVPPWQAHGVMGGPSPIHSLSCHDDVVLVNETRQIVSMTPPQGFGAASFHHETLREFMARAELPTHRQVHDEFGYASGALRYDLALGPAETRDVFVAIPFGSIPSAAGVRGTLPADAVAAAPLLEQTAAQWRRKLDSVDLHLPQLASAIGKTFKTAAAHILVNRDRVALQPGPRRYARTWMRDGATMCAALLRADCAQEARDFVSWFARFQRADGAIPAIVDRTGVDPLPEHDSHGQFLYTIAEVFRFTGDREFLQRMWPAMVATTRYIRALREQRLGPEYQRPEKNACYGLLPESVSHEGYLAHPVHAYWDDFWTLRGLKDAVAMARVVGDRDSERDLAAMCESFRDTLYASIRTTMAQRGIAYIPGSVEWADIDPSATATAITTVDEPEHLPHGGLDRTFADYFAHFDDCRSGRAVCVQYTPYEIRLIGALVRLGQREQALRLLRFFCADRRPPAWNSWTEIVWTDPQTPAHIGDMPHSWIGAEFMLAARTLFVYERERDASLVLAAGVDAAWLADGFELRAQNIPTYYGTIGYTLRAEAAGTLVLELEAAPSVPPGGFVLRPPLPGDLLYAEVDGVRVAADCDGVTVGSCPASVRLYCQAPSAPSASTAS